MSLFELNRVVVQLTSRPLSTIKCWISIWQFHHCSKCDYISIFQFNTELKGETLRKPCDESTGLSDIFVSQDISVEVKIIPMRSCIQELNESVQNTILCDLKAIGKKFMHALYPRKSNIFWEIGIYESFWSFVWHLY